MFRVLASLAGAGLALAGGHAQAVEPGPNSATISSAAPSCALVELVEALSNQDRVLGSSFRLRLVAPITVDGVDVPAGTPGLGEVVDAGKPGLTFGPGKLVLTAAKLTYAGRDIPLSGFAMVPIDVSPADLSPMMPRIGVLSPAANQGHFEIAAGTRALATLVPPATLPNRDAQGGRTARVVFFRSWFWNVSKLHPVIFESNRQIGITQDGGHFSIDVAPGTHTFTFAADRTDGLTVEAAPDDEIYIRILIEPHGLTWKTTFVLSKKLAFETLFPEAPHCG